MCLKFRQTGRFLKPSVFANPYLLPETWIVHKSRVVQRADKGYYLVFFGIG
jgi:hypothetical protein